MPQSETYQKPTCNQVLSVRPVSDTITSTAVEVGYEFQPRLNYVCISAGSHQSRPVPSLTERIKGKINISDWFLPPDSFHSMENW